MKRIFTEEEKAQRKLISKAWREVNKERDNARQRDYEKRPNVKAKRKEWRDENKDKTKAALAKYRSTAEYKEKNKTLAAKYRAENVEKLRLNRIKYNDRPENIARKAAAKHNGKLVIEPPTRPRPLTCDICNGTNEHNARMHFDHCHITGRFRGWLCSKCNMALGLLNDDKERLAKLIEYLK
jgi:hypothetical protein